MVYTPTVRQLYRAGGMTMSILESKQKCNWELCFGTTTRPKVIRGKTLPGATKAMQAAVSGLLAHRGYTYRWSTEMLDTVPTNRINRSTPPTKFYIIHVYNSVGREVNSATMQRMVPSATPIKEK